MVNLVKLVISYQGCKCWYSFYSCHRTNGPAVIYPDGTVEWYLDGRRISEYEHMMIMGQAHG